MQSKTALPASLSSFVIRTENEYIDLILCDLPMTPKEAAIAVTYRCNSKCSMCNIWRIKEFVEIDSREYSKLPRSLRTINVTGGEPFLRRNIVDVLRVLHEASPNARIVFSTNGYLTDVILGKIEEIRSFHGNVGVGVSIDGLEETHDRIRGVQGMFSNGIETIEGLKRMGISDLRIALTIQNENVNEVAKVFDMSRMLGVEFSTTMAHNSEVYFQKTDNEPNEVAISESEDIDYVSRSMLKSRHPKDWFRAFHVSGISDSSIRRCFRSRCEAGHRYVFIAPDGNVYPCNVMDEPMGNLTQVTSWDALNTPGVKERVHASVRGCNRDCWMVCNTRSLIIAHPIRAGRWVLWRKVAAHLGRGD